MYIVIKKALVSHQDCGKKINEIKKQQQDYEKKNIKEIKINYNC